MESPLLQVVQPNYSFETPTGLAVVAQERSDKQVELDLKRLDPALFLTREKYQPTGQWSYAVYHYISSNHPPVHVLYWTEDRTRRGRPLPLSSGIVYEVESRKQNFDRNIVADAIADNEAKVQRDIEAADEERETEVVPYFKRRLKFGPSTRDRLHADDPFERIAQRERARG